MREKKLHICYFCGGRAEELPLLTFLKTQNKIDFKVLQYPLLRNANLSILISYLLELKRIMNSNKFDIYLIEGGGFFNPLYNIYAKLNRSKLAIRIKGDLWQVFREIKHDISCKEALAKILNHLGLAISLRMADALLPISQYIKDVIKNNLSFLGPLPVVNILPQFHKNYDQESQSPEDDNLPQNFIVTVTNFNFWQKIEPLILAIKSYAYHVNKVGLDWLILGDGFFFDEFKTKIQEKIDRNFVKVIGRQNPYPYYNKAKALFYFSGMDGLPNVMLEAFVMKLPVVMNNDCPAKEFLRYDNGILIDLQNAAEMKSLINEIARNRKDFKNITEKAFKYLEQTFSVEAVSLQLENALMGIMEKS